MRHTLSVNNWFKKQCRTAADTKLDNIDPFHLDPSPIDRDTDLVSPATFRDLPSSSNRPVKGGYWFIRDKYQDEVKAAIERDIKEMAVRMEG